MLEIWPCYLMAICHIWELASLVRHACGDSSILFNMCQPLDLGVVDPLRLPYSWLWKDYQQNKSLEASSGAKKKCCRIKLSCIGEVLTSDEVMERTERAYLGRAAKKKSIKKSMYWSFTMVHCHCCSELAYFMKVDVIWGGWIYSALAEGWFLARKALTHHFCPSSDCSYPLLALVSSLVALTTPTH